jgi:dihydroorotate dehydrogenase (fumarate)
MDLTTEWLGMTLKNPFVPSASPLTRSLDASRQLEDAGAGAIVMHSLFEEAVRADDERMAADPHNQDIGHAEADSYLPFRQDFPGELDLYLEQVAALKATLEIPVIASLNGVTASGWMKHAKEVEEAGADALELNAYYIAGDIGEAAHDVEQRYLAVLQELRGQVSVPINMKLSPFFSSVGNMVKKLEDAGVSGVSLFNRFYQPDIDIDGMRLQHTLTPSRPSDALLAMHWAAMLHRRVNCSIAATGGIYGAEDAIKVLLAGADVVHQCHALLQKGPAHLGSLISGTLDWMEQMGFDRLDDFRGRVSQASVQDPSNYERLNYVRVIGGQKKSDPD